jgi:hypothetical protein
LFLLHNLVSRSDAKIVECLMLLMLIFDLDSPLWVLRYFSHTFFVGEINLVHICDAVLC